MLDLTQFIITLGDKTITMVNLHQSVIDFMELIVIPKELLAMAINALLDGKI